MRIPTDRRSVAWLIVDLALAIGGLRALVAARFSTTSVATFVAAAVFAAVFLCRKRPDERRFPHSRNGG